CARRADRHYAMDYW
nr:immunoglobulin heavy chain junction region [Mus musculus]